MTLFWKNITFTRIEKDLEFPIMKFLIDDIWVTTFPKSGTTWVQEMVWLISNNLDFGTALSISLDERFPFIE